MKIEKTDKIYVLTCAPWCTHRRGKNYASIILGRDPKFGYRREFLEKGYGNQYLFSKKPKAGQIIEVRAIYYTGGGYPEPLEGSGFYRIEADGSLTMIPEVEVKQLFKSKPETF